MSKFVIAAALGLGLLSVGGAAQAQPLPPHRPHVVTRHHHYVPPPRVYRHHPAHVRDWRHARQYGAR